MFIPVKCQTINQEVSAIWRSFSLLSENCVRYSNSRGCRCPVITREWSGGPRSASFISCSVQANICCVSEPTRASPTHKVVLVYAAKHVMTETTN